MAGAKEKLRRVSSSRMTPKLRAREAETHAVEDGNANEMHIVYLYIAEDGTGFRWQVLAHGLSEPLVAGTELFSSMPHARDAGSAALDRICSQFDGFHYLK